MNSYQLLAVTLILPLSHIGQADPLAINLTAPTRDFTRLEKFERAPGGTATYQKTLNSSAFSHASANMESKREINFKVGKGFFKRLWVSAPASTQAADGLGPLYNARSCQQCHIRDGRGQPPAGAQSKAVSLFLRLSIPPQNDQDQRNLIEHNLSVIPEPTYGTQLQDFAIAGHRAEGQIQIDYVENPVQLGDGHTVMLRKPSYTIKNLAYGPLHPQTMLSARVAPQMIGLGLLEAISSNDILALDDPDDKDRNGISGKANRVWSSEFQQETLGRFGWKASQPSINEQTQSAFFHDLGISVPLHPDGAGECTVHQEECNSTINGNSPQYENLEAPSSVVDLVNLYSRNLAVPARRNPDAPEVLDGKKLFYDIGCIQCHTPKFITQRDAIGLEQSHQLIWPYTDLLLHDMGEGLADNRPEGEANGREWRTAPLWGIGLIPQVNKHSFYLHDGRARNLLEAILWHGGEAKPHRNAVINLNKTDRENLIRFLESL